MVNKIKVLNLYAGIGGNRKLWENVEVTAVENNKDIAKIYGEFFPEDNVVIADAHEYLLKHFREFDFIWSSPPCQTHSKLRTLMKKVVYPDMTLYQEIILLRKWFKGKWVVENVKPYYPTLLHGTEIQRHILWTNFPLHSNKFKGDNIRRGTVESLEKHHGIEIRNFDVKNKRQLLRNCVAPKLGKHILNCAYSKQTKIW